MKNNITILIEETVPLNSPFVLDENGNEIIINRMNHKEWLDNEYSEWIKALQESTVHNFKEHPVVKRMLGEVQRVTFWGYVEWIREDYKEKIKTIDNIGTDKDLGLSGTCVRMVYYAQEVLKRNPSSICEIGGGVGQFYAILRALGYDGMYYIHDLPEVKEFQDKYLLEVKKLAILNTDQRRPSISNMVVSFYSLGEFDDEKKKYYFDTVVNKTPHGYIAWNAHSGASDDLSLFKHDIKVTPGIEPGIKIIEW